MTDSVRKFKQFNCPPPYKATQRRTSVERNSMVFLLLN